MPRRNPDGRRAAAFALMLVSASSFPIALPGFRAIAMGSSITSDLGCWVILFTATTTAAVVCWVTEWFKPLEAPIETTGSREVPPTKGPRARRGQTSRGSAEQGK